MADGLSSVVALVLSSCMLVGGQNCLISVTAFHFNNVTVSAESVGGSTPGARVTWNTTVPPECMASVRVEFRTSSSHGPAVANYTTTNTSQTEIIQTGLQCATSYYIRVVVTGEIRRHGGLTVTVMLSPRSDVQSFVGDIPVPIVVRAEATADNTSIRVSWEWSHQGVSMCVDLVRVHYQPEGGSLMMYTVDNTTATSVTLPNLQCNTKYTIWVYARGGPNNTRSVPRMVNLPARALPTPTNVTAEVMSASSFRVAWQWTSSGPAPNCFNTTTVTYHPERDGDSSLELSDPAATEATLTGLQCNISYTITVVATAGGHMREGVAVLLQGLQNLSASVLSPTSVHLRLVAPCHTQQYHIYYRGTCGTYVDEGRLDTDHPEYTLDGLHGDINYSFSVDQTGFSGGRVLSAGPVYARTFTAVPSGAPLSLEAMFVQSTEVYLRWREVPCFQQNGPIAGYVVRYYPACGADRGIQSNKSVVTTAVIINGLTSNTEYAFQVTAVNVNGTGPFSEPITLGGAPQLVVVTPVNSTTVTVSWSEVQCFNGSEAVTHYLVHYQSLCGGVVHNVTTNSLVQNVSGLALNVAEYTFRVAAVGSGQKMGPLSNPVNTVLYCAGERGSSCDSSLDEPQSACFGSLAAALAGVAVTAVLVLLVVAGVQSAVISHLRRSIARIKTQTQRATAVTTEISLKECSAYGQIDHGGRGEREENYIYEHPQ